MTSFVFCRGCAAQIHETAPACPKCGASQGVSAGVEKSHATGISMERPAQLQQAIKALWCCFFFGIVHALQMMLYVRQASSGFGLLVAGITIAILALLIRKISQGKNWARISYLVLFLIGVLPGLANIEAEFALSKMLGASSLFSICLQGYALFLLFRRPANTWFKVSK